MTNFHHVGDCDDCPVCVPEAAQAAMRLLDAGYVLVSWKTGRKLTVEATRGMVHCHSRSDDYGQAIIDLEAKVAEAEGKL